MMQGKLPDIRSPLFFRCFGELLWGMYVSYVHDVAPPFIKAPVFFMHRVPGTKKKRFSEKDKCFIVFKIQLIFSKKLEFAIPYK